MRVRFWGVRGALAATRGTAQGVGGNTPCIEIRDGQDTLVILDAGIGLYWLGRTLMAGAYGRGKGKATLLFSHTHWDHIQGFPFFVPAFIPGNEIDLWGGGVDRLDAILEGQMNPTYSPLASISNMGATIKVGNLDNHQELTVGELRIRHATFRNGHHDIVGYRIEEQGRSLCYVAEAEHPSDGLNPAIIELARGTDTLIHEAYYTNEELTEGGTSLAGPSAPSASGHSSFAEATDVALEAGVKRLFYFYHHPDHDDATIQRAVDGERKRVASAKATLQLQAAQEGFEFEV